MALLALIPTKDKIYGALLVAVLLAGWYEYEHLQTLGAQHELVLIKAGEKKADDAARKQAADDTTDYAAKLKASQDAFNASLKVAMDSSGALAERVRQYEATSHTCPVLQGPAAPGAGAALGAGRDQAIADAIASLVVAAEHDLVVSESERQERDALTGK